MMIRLICVAIGYVFGLFQTSYIYGKMHGIDIRTQGSGNAGTTNALRVLGKKAGAITFLGDALKCVAAVLLVQALFGASHGDIRPLLAIYAGAGVVLGHNFPFYLGFKGGKGIAASAGMMLALPFPDFCRVRAGLYSRVYHHELCVAGFHGAVPLFSGAGDLSGTAG